MIIGCALLNGMQFTADQDGFKVGTVSAADHEGKTHVAFVLQGRTKNSGQNVTIPLSAVAVYEESAAVKPARLVQ